MEETINELLLEAYKKSYEAQSSLVKAKDAIINFLEAHIDELNLELSQCKKDSMSYTGLTDEEFEEIEKLTEEIMKEDYKGSIKVTLGGESVFHEAVELVNKLIKTQKNTTTENSGVRQTESMSYTDYLESIQPLPEQ